MDFEENKPTLDQLLCELIECKPQLSSLCQQALVEHDNMKQNIQQLQKDYCHILDHSKQLEFELRQTKQQLKLLLELDNANLTLEPVEISQELTLNNKLSISSTISTTSLTDWESQLITLVNENNQLKDTISHMKISIPPAIQQENHVDNNETLDKACARCDELTKSLFNLRTSMETTIKNLSNERQILNERILQLEDCEIALRQSLTEHEFKKREQDNIISCLRDRLDESHARLTSLQDDHITLLRTKHHSNSQIPRTSSVTPSTSLVLNDETDDDTELDIVDTYDSYSRFTVTPKQLLDKGNKTYSPINNKCLADEIAEVMMTTKTSSMLMPSAQQRMRFYDNQIISKSPLSKEIGDKNDFDYAVPQPDWGGRISAFSQGDVQLVPHPQSQNCFNFPPRDLLSSPFDGNNSTTYVSRQSRQTTEGYQDDISFSLKSEMTQYVYDNSQCQRQDSFLIPSFKRKVDYVKSLSGSRTLKVWKDLATPSVTSALFESSPRTVQSRVAVINRLEVEENILPPNANETHSHGDAQAEHPSPSSSSGSPTLKENYNPKSNLNWNQGILSGLFGLATDSWRQRSRPSLLTAVFGDKQMTSAIDRELPHMSNAVGLNGLSSGNEAQTKQVSQKQANHVVHRFHALSPYNYSSSEGPLDEIVS